MFYCKSCGYEFDHADVTYETHGLQSPPFEEICVCPACRSTDFFEKSSTHCRCCGSRLPAGAKDYCCETCRTRGEKLWKKERKRRNVLSQSPLNLLVKEVDAYNRKNGTNYSYGQYVALIQPKGRKKYAKR